MKKLRGLAVAAALLLSSLSALPASAAATLDDALRRLQADDVLVSDAAVEEIVALGEAGADALLELLDDDRRDVRAGAIRGLGLLGDPRAGAPIRAILEETLALSEPDTMSDRYFRILSIQALGRIGDRESEPLLLGLSGSEDAFERAHASISLFLLGVDPGYDLVRECLADTAMAIRNVAVDGLGRATDTRTLGLVLPMTEDESWIVRDGAYRALWAWRTDEDARQALERGSQDPSWFVRETVREIQTGGREE